MVDAMEGVETATQPDQTASGSYFLNIPSSRLINSTAIRANFSLLERAVAQFDSRFTLRALRSISGLRKQLDQQVLGHVIASSCPPGQSASVLLQATGLDEDAADELLEAVKSPPTKKPIPEIEIYLGILIQVRPPPTK